MADLVQIAINGQDNTSAAFNRVLGNTQKLSKEMKSFGTVIGNVGSAASTLGNTNFANLASKTSTLIATGEALAFTFRKVNLTLKGSIIGLVTAAAAFGAAKWMEYTEAADKANEATQKAIDLRNQLAQTIASLRGTEQGEAEAQGFEHEKRLKQIEELEQAGADADALKSARLSEQALNERQMNLIALKFSQQKIDKKEQETAKNRAQLLQQLGDTSAFFGNLASVTAAFGKKAFGLTKALRAAEAIVNTASAVTNALASPVPWPIPLIFAAAAAAAGAVQIATIASAKYGQAHGGLEYVPSEATYVLDEGERVLAPKQNAQLQEFLDRGQAMSVTINLDGRTFAKWAGEASRDGRLVISARAIV